MHPNLKPVHDFVTIHIKGIETAERRQSGPATAPGTFSVPRNPAPAKSAQGKWVTRLWQIFNHFEKFGIDKTAEPTGPPFYF
jgi:hypothetical protein